MISAVLIGEADKQVGFGHLCELLAIANALGDQGVCAKTYVIGERPTDTAWEGACWVSNSEALGKVVAGASETISVWSFRRRLDQHLRDLFGRIGSMRIWVTDQPEQAVAADLVVVSGIQSKGFDWSVPTLMGLDFLPLETCYEAPPPTIDNRPHDVLLSMGGADRTGASLRLLPALAEFDSTVVIGPGFTHRREVGELGTKLRIRIIDSANGLFQLLRSHRLVITAGGNTLTEAAASGTPALVAWEDPHEREQGFEFQRLGAALVLGQGQTVNVQAARHEVAGLLSNPERLNRLSAAGRKAVDGKGARRIVEAILARVA